MTKKAPATKDGLASLKPRKITGKAGDSIRGGTEVSKKVWDYIKKNSLQDKAKKTL